MSIARVLSLSFIMLSVVAGAAPAQDAGAHRGAGGPSADQGRWDPAAMRQHEDARRAERARALHDVLGIQPSQEPAFTAFTTTMSAPDRRPDGDRGRDGRGGAGDRTEGSAALTTPERLDQMKARMDHRFAEMREAFDRRAQATKTFYAALDPRQRAVMDALPELAGHGHGAGRMGHMGRPGAMGAGM